MQTQIKPSVKLFITKSKSIIEANDETIEASYQTLIKASETEATMQAYLMDIIEVITQTNNIIAKS